MGKFDPFPSLSAALKSLQNITNPKTNKGKTLQFPKHLSNNNVPNENLYNEESCIYN